ncbi:MAG: hypothetical protein ACI36W_05175 [Coriobacteriales bacterium]
MQPETGRDLERAWDAAERSKNRHGYRCVAEDLAHIAALPGGKAAAKKLADMIRDEYPRIEAETAVMDDYPNLQGMYQPGDGNCGALLCHFDQANEVSAWRNLGLSQGTVSRERRSCKSTRDFSTTALARLRSK